MLLNLKQLMFLKITKTNQKPSKNFVIKDFLTNETGIASFFQPKWTSLLIVSNIFSSEGVSKTSVLIFYSKKRPLLKFLLHSEISIYH